MPAFVKVKEYLSSVSRAFDRNTPSSLTMTCGMSSRLTHVTVVFTRTVSDCGPKVKLSTRTSAAWGFVSLLALSGFDIKTTTVNPIAVITAGTNIFLFFIHFLFDKDLLYSAPTRGL